MFIAILVLIAKLSLVTALPIATIIVWQKRTNAQWISLPFCLLAFFVDFLAQLALSETVPEFSNGEAFIPLLAFFASVSGTSNHILWVLTEFISGLIREGGRWLIFRYAATKVRLWQDGVLFGLGYSVIALLQLVGEQFSRAWPGLNLSEYSIVEKIEYLNYVYGWTATWYFPFYWVVSLLAFNVCTSVAVLASVQRRKIRYLLIAIVAYIAYATGPPEMMKHFQRVDIEWLGLGQDASRIIKQQLVHPLLALPFLVVIFRLRKPI